MDEKLKAAVEDPGEGLASPVVALKALGNGKVEGYAVVFGDEVKTDVAGEYFTVRTDYDLGEPQGQATAYYHHGMDPEIGTRKFVTRKAILTTDAVGVWFQHQLDLRDEYEKSVYQLAEMGKLGLSTGAPAHLVRREQKAAAREILAWPIAEVSYTPVPVEPRTRVQPVKSLTEVVSFKALVAGLVEEDEALKAALPVGPDQAWDADAAEKRVRAWAKAEGGPNARYGRAFLYKAGEGKEFGDFKLPFCDVVDGKLMAMPRGIVAAYGGRGVNAADIPEEDKERIRQSISGYAARVREAMPEMEMMPPWEKPAKKDAEAKALSLSEQDQLVSDALRDFLNKDLPQEKRPWVSTWVYPAYVAYRKEDNGQTSHVQRSYSLLDGTVTFGETETPVERGDWKPIKSQDEGLSPGEMTFEDHTQSVLAAATGWRERAQAIRELRAQKAGRVLSQMNRGRLQQMHAAMGEVMAQMQALLEETQTEDAPAKSLSAAERGIYRRRAELRELMLAR